MAPGVLAQAWLRGRHSVKSKTQKASEQNKNRDFYETATHGRRAVCKRCHVVMVDYENPAPYGEFHHPEILHRGALCPNSGKGFDTTSEEVVPFMSKKERRRCKRLKLRP